MFKQWFHLLSAALRSRQKQKRKLLQAIFCFQQSVSFIWILLLLSNTSVTFLHQTVPRPRQYINVKRAHVVSLRQQPSEDSYLLCFPSMSEWKVKVNPWCLSVNWAYYVSASVWKGRREGRKEERSNRVPVFAETNVTVSFSRTMAWHTDSALMLLFTN